MRGQLASGPICSQVLKVQLNPRFPHFDFAFMLASIPHHTSFYKYQTSPYALFQDLAAMGRFTLRDEGRTIAIGKVTKLPKVH